jgi:hypothetical protein
MIFREFLKNGLVKAELDTSGTDAILRIEVDSVVLESERGEYEREAETNMPNYEYDMHKKEFNIIDSDVVADRNVKIEIDSGLKEAREWAREKTKKRIKVVFTEE